MWLEAAKGAADRKSRVEKERDYRFSSYAQNQSGSELLFFREAAFCSYLVVRKRHSDFSEGLGLQSVILNTENKLLILTLVCS